MDCRKERRRSGKKNRREAGKERRARSTGSKRYGEAFRNSFDAGGVAGRTKEN